jgi:hypothetical protein
MPARWFLRLVDAVVLGDKSLAIDWGADVCALLARRQLDGILLDPLVGELFE